MRNWDYVVIGAGIVGLATALQILRARPKAKICVVEKERAVAGHQTSHNSGVIHSGVYYKPDSVKARTCVEGSHLLTKFCVQHNIAVRTCGKIIVATHPVDLPRLDELERRGHANGVNGLRRISKDELRELEPHVHGHSGLLAPNTSIVDFAQVALAYAKEIREAGGEILLNTAVTALHTPSSHVVIETSKETLAAKTVINCAGLHSDRIARLAAGPKVTTHIIPFRGEYYLIKPQRADMVRHLIYPVPNPAFPFLGVHLTPKIDGSLEAGPNAVFATAREGYSKGIVNGKDCWECFKYSGFWRMLSRYWKTGLGEIHRSFSKRAFLIELQKLAPSLTLDDLHPGGAGVRAQVVMPNGTLCDDFLIRRDDNIIHVLNVPSPAATASLAIGSHIVNKVLDLDHINSVPEKL